MEIAFLKMNGAGNDFVMLDNRSGELALDGDQVARLCDRHRGVGADGLLMATRQEGQLAMRYFNADGGEAEMCGNGARCFARFAARLENLEDSISFLTGAGPISADLHGPLVSLRMSDPHSLRPPVLLSLAGNTREIHFLNTGVPHAVAFVEDLDGLDILAEGAAARYHEAFAPSGTNANFVRIVEPGLLRIRTYERGVEGETLACGTGVCAAALLHARLSHWTAPVRVTVKGGDTLQVSFQQEGDSFRDVVLTGPADFVFEGRISL